MPKPTLVQQFLRRPSQSYSSPPSSSRRATDKKDFHSVKDEMVKAANASASGATLGAMQSTDSAATSKRAPKRDKKKGVNEAEEESVSSDEVYYTPDTTPRESYYGEAEGEIKMDEIAERIFGIEAVQDVISNIGLKLPHPSSPPSHTRSPSSTSTTSSYSLASTSTAPTSRYSSSDKTSLSLSPVSTRATTPASTDNSVFDDTGSLERQSSKGSTRRRRKTHIKSKSEDWAKDVRWLVPPNEHKPKSPSASTSSSSSRRQKPAPSAEPDMLQTLSPTPIPDRIPSMPRRANSLKARPTARRTVGKRRMSAVWEEDEGDDIAKDTQQRRALPGSLPNRSLSLSSPPPSHPPRTRAASLHSQGTGASSLSSSFTSSSKVVDIPTPLPVSDGGNPSGFTSLVLPRAACTPTSNRRYSVLFGNDEKVDLTRSGKAQTTMSTISITKNAATAALGSRPRFLSLSSFTIHMTGSSSSLKVSSATPAHLLSSLPPPVSITSHTPPPSKVHSNQVLVQVYAVGIDNLDDLIVSEKAARSDSYGFVPGRSFVGRAVECGFEVNKISRSDWVMGILDVRKCGALSEFVVVDKRRLTRCPRPSAELTMEQLALLPLCGVPAHRAVRTSDSLQRGARALVLHGHDGAGALAVQELSAYGVYVTAQIPPIVSTDKLMNERLLSEAEERVRNWGAQEIIVDNPVAAVNQLHESQYDLVIDTIGGRRIWDACRRVLHTMGQFTTLVGESSRAVPTINAHFKSNMRSLRRAFVKKDHKSIGYAWISPAADVDNDGEDIRDSLDIIGKLAIDGLLRPLVATSRIVPFERAPTLFSHEENILLSEGRTAIVRIID